MGDTTHISWADMTFNAWIGCTEVSVGPKGACVGCYAREYAKRYGRAEWGNHPRQRTSAANWKKPFAWNKQAEKDGTRPFVFCSSLADVFDNQVDPQWRRDLFDLIRATPNLTWLLLTKRPQNIQRLFAQVGFLDVMTGPAQIETSWPRNAAIGCTVVTQAEADRDIPVLLTAKGVLRPAFAFLSVEPLMGAVDLNEVANDGDSYWDALRGHDAEVTIDGVACEHVDWVITGGETDQGKHKARPSHPDWFRSLRDQCAAAGVAYHHKQNGEWAPLADTDPGERTLTRSTDVMVWPDGETGGGTHTQHGGLGSLMRKVGKKSTGRLLDGVVHDARPVIR